jgi:hypothetical protein
MYIKFYSLVALINCPIGDEWVVQTSESSNPHKGCSTRYLFELGQS